LLKPVTGKQRLRLDAMQGRDLPSMAMSRVEPDRIVPQ
jgi:hypothetical protein